MNIASDYSGKWFMLFTTTWLMGKRLKSWDKHLKCLSKFKKLNFANWKPWLIAHTKLESTPPDRNSEIGRSASKRLLIALVTAFLILLRW